MDSEKQIEKPKNKFVDSLKIVSAIWIVGTLAVSFYQTSFLHKNGVDDIPLELYGEIAGSIMAYCVIAIPFVYMFLKFLKR